MAYIVTFERNALDQDQVLVRILDDSTGSFVEQTRLEIGYAQYNASVVGGLVSVTNKTTLEALFETQPYDLYRRNTAPYNTWGFDAASTVTMLNVEIGGSATGSSPPPAFMFSNFIAGGNTITPDNTADTLTFTAGSGISIAGNISTDTITISASGGGGSSYSTVRTQSGTSYTLALTDAGNYIQTTSTTAVTITVPLQSSVAWAADTEIYFEQNNTGQITIAGASGVTINSSETLKSFARYSVLALKRVASDVWTLTGERALV